MVITPTEFWLVQRLADCLSMMDMTDLVLLINDEGQVAVTHRMRLLATVTDAEREELWANAYKIMPTLARTYIEFVHPAPPKENL